MFSVIAWACCKMNCVRWLSLDLMTQDGSSRLSVVSGSMHYFKCFRVVACLPRSPVVCSWAHGLITRLLGQRKGVLGMADELSGITMKVSFSGVCDATGCSTYVYTVNAYLYLDIFSDTKMFSLSVMLPPKLGTRAGFCLTISSTSSTSSQNS